jgi:hypothetical protein
VILEGYSRTILAGMIAPTEATWVALMVLYTACLRYGAPVHLVSDSGGAYTSADFEAVCTRLQIQHETIVSTQGESYLNWMETQHQGLLKDRRVPPIPVEVLGAAKGRMYAPEELAHYFSQAVFPRVTKWDIRGSVERGDDLIGETPPWHTPSRPHHAGTSPACLRSNTCSSRSSRSWCSSPICYMAAWDTSSSSPAKARCW